MIKPLLRLSVLAALLLPCASAFPIAVSGTEGLSVFVLGNQPVVATYQGNSATYSNDLYLMLDGNGLPGNDGNFANDLFIFNNQASPVGSTVQLGAFATGTELIFRLLVNNTGDNFYTGPAGRNADLQPHARVESNWQPGETLVSFEDLYNGPFSYNDLSFSFTNTTSNATPEPGSLLLCAAALGVLGVLRRKSRT